MVIDLHAKIRVKICKGSEKKSRKLFDRWNLLSRKPVISQKSMEHNKSQTRSVNHARN